MKNLKNHIQTTLKTTALFVSLSSPHFTYAQTSIGITQIVDHPSLNEIRIGIIEELAENGYVEGKNLDVTFESAQGNPILASQIAQKFSSLPLDVIVPISTPSAQAMVQQVTKTPIVFAAITDPLKAKVVSSLKHPGGNVTGVTDAPPLPEQLNFIETCVPHLKNLGVVYNPGEVNSVTFLEGVKKQLKKKNIKGISAAAPKSSDVQAAANSLVGRVDAIFIGNDNTVVSGLEPLIKACIAYKIPLFVSDPQSVKRGALAAYAYDQRQIGHEVGKVVAQILKGKKPGDIPVKRATALEYTFNPETAEKVKVTCAIAQ